MKPVKSLLPASRWLLRITMLTYLIMQHGKTIVALQYETRPFYIASAFVLFGILLFAGGFTSKPSLTVVSALLLCLLFAYYIYLNFVPQITEPQVLKLLLFSVCLYFVSSANK
ncbi:MAG: hypothetical protein H6541_14095 [Lentimicrobiaceae bacterium]|nr:hypothetical protein [Lentimicrobiaceae bacterium]MCO5265041.1 hypothetical protein [Lentimicrobium sp.]HPG32346.1 hypothetical protein [Lentimicrobium sp.]